MTARECHPQIEVDTRTKERLARLLEGNRRALSQLMTQVDADPDRTEWLDRLPSDRRALHIGLTGAGGAGKSTLAGALVTHARKQGKSIAVLASDPVSPFTGGALLGDRVRMDYDPGDAGVFIRSLSARGGDGGGLAPSTQPMLRLCDAFGFDVVLVETVGAGQDQLAVRELVDVLVLVVTPAGGDEIQWEKAGVMEAVDLIVVNKADLPGADGVVAAMKSMLELVPHSGRPIPILKAVASRADGLPEVWDALWSANQSGDKRGREHAVLGEARRRVWRQLESLWAAPMGRQLAALLTSGQLGVHEGVDKLLELFHKTSAANPNIPNNQEARDGQP